MHTSQTFNPIWEFHRKAKNDFNWRKYMIFLVICAKKCIIFKRNLLAAQKVYNMPITICLWRKKFLIFGFYALGAKKNVIFLVLGAKKCIIFERNLTAVQKVHNFPKQFVCGEKKFLIFGFLCLRR